MGLFDRFDEKTEGLWGGSLNDPKTWVDVPAHHEGFLNKIMGGDAKRHAQNTADRQMEEMLAKAEGRYSGVDMPSLDELTSNPEIIKYLGDFSPEEMKYMGDYDPRLANLSKQEDSRLLDLSMDPRLKAERSKALDALSDISEGGMNLSDLAMLEDIRGRASSADRGRRESILQNMRQRGMSGGGMELLAQLQSSQDAAEMESRGGLQQAAMAEQRALDALIQGGNLANQFGQQDLQSEMQKMSAQDAINRFNAANANQMGQFNVANQNQAMLRNLDTRQGLSNQNVGNMNQAQMRNLEIQQGLAGQNANIINQNRAMNNAAQQQMFQNQKALADAKAGLDMQKGDWQWNANQQRQQQAAAQNAQGTGALFTAAGSMFGPVGAAAGGAASSQMNKK